MPLLATVPAETSGGIPESSPDTVYSGMPSLTSPGFAISAEPLNSSPSTFMLFRPRALAASSGHEISGQEAEQRGPALSSSVAVVCRPRHRRYCTPPTASAMNSSADGNTLIFQYLGGFALLPWGKKESKSNVSHPPIRNSSRLLL